MKSAGRKQWNKRVHKVIGILDTLLNYDHLFIGGGNARHIKFKPPKNVTLVSNDAGIEGGAALWKLALAGDAHEGRRRVGHTGGKP
jgi:polyphosphate glucokinase